MSWHHLFICIINVAEAAGLLGNPTQSSRAEMARRAPAFSRLVGARLVADAPLWSYRGVVLPSPLIYHPLVTEQIALGSSCRASSRHRIPPGCCRAGPCQLSTNQAADPQDCHTLRGLGSSKVLGGPKAFPGSPLGRLLLLVPLLPLFPACTLCQGSPACAPCLGFLPALPARSSVICWVQLCPLLTLQQLALSCVPGLDPQPPAEPAPVAAC